ncbi:MAG: cyclohexa-1,5-dienecarbonyl-CoA hydratase [Gammaproteobacteria bacterium]|nr:cyclohexa-1,5-dienecarbonyl-CoA hydratase [Gammaproteobacteria bacterium]
MSAPLRVDFERDGRVLRLELARPKANIVDAAMIDALDTALAAHLDTPALMAVLLSAQGPNFSFGASVPEHMPDQCAAMLARLHALLKRMLACPVPILAAVRGQCLGGGLEVVLASSYIVAAPDARLGQPEIKVGVFAPAASCLLPPRVGQSHAEDLLWSGRAVAADEARVMGLVDAIADDPDAAALEHFDRSYAGHSAAVLRHAVRAVRAPLARRVAAHLDEVERLYLDELMRTHDAVEGLNAFLDKRAPVWLHR